AAGSVTLSGSYFVEGHIARDFVLVHDIPHASLHAVHFALIVVATVVEPARVVAVETALVIFGEAFPPAFAAVPAVAIFVARVRGHRDVGRAGGDVARRVGVLHSAFHLVDGAVIVAS